MSATSWSVRPAFNNLVQNVPRRYTNPNLNQLALIEVRYPGVPMLSSDEEECGRDPHLAAASPEKRAELFHCLFDTMRQGLAIQVDALDRTALEQVAQRSREYVKPPWSISREEEERDLARQGTLVVGKPDGRIDPGTIKASAQSALGRALDRALKQGGLGGVPAKEREPLIQAMLEAAEAHQIVRRVGQQNRSRRACGPRSGSQNKVRFAPHCIGRMRSPARCRRFRFTNLKRPSPALAIPRPSA